VTRPRPYSDPYVAGVALGLVLLASFAFTGRGLGASGAFSSTVAGVVDAPYFARYTADGPWWRDWLVFEIAGVAIGGFLSAWLAGRLRGEVERGPRATRSTRLAIAFAGGAVMGIGAVLARGCTSGLALTGGALFAVGAWLFMITAFAGAYLAAPALRRVWR
jgi:uncharacterized protein